MCCMYWKQKITLWYFMQSHIHVWLTKNLVIGWLWSLFHLCAVRLFTILTPQTFHFINIYGTYVHVCVINTLTLFRSCQFHCKSIHHLISEPYVHKVIVQTFFCTRAKSCAVSLNDEEFKLFRDCFELIQELSSSEWGKL